MLEDEAENDGGTGFIDLTAMGVLIFEDDVEVISTRVMLFGSM